VSQRRPAAVTFFFVCSSSASPKLRFADHTRDLIFLNVDPGYDSLRKDARFLTRLRQMRLAT
jgi:hypothetical protein